MPKPKKPKSQLTDHAKQIAKLGAIKIPTMIKSQMHHFMDEEKPYCELLKYLEQFDYYDEDGDSPPAFSNIAKALKMSPSKLNRICMILYDDLMQYLGGWGEVWGYKPNDLKVETHSVRFSLFFVGLSNSVNIQLPFVPRIGERISIDIGQYLVGCTQFYVCDVWHHVENGSQNISVYCSYKKENVGRDGLDIWGEAQGHVVEMLK